MAFPASPSNNQVHKEGNRSFVYDSTLGTWDQVKEIDNASVPNSALGSTPLSTPKISTDQMILTPGIAPVATEGAMYYNDVLKAVFVYNGSAWKEMSAQKAEGGTVSTDGTYIYHTFTTGGFFWSWVDITLSYLIVAGGGGGGSSVSGSGGGGGGGAGGYLSGTGAYNAHTSYEVVIGAGGAQRSGGSGSVGNSGVASTALGLSATGGGGGDAGNATGSPQTGGSGGGAGYQNYSTGVSGANGVSGQGYKGGDITHGSGYPNGAGGGGAGGEGIDNGVSGQAGGVGRGWLDGNTYAVGGTGGGVQIVAGPDNSGNGGSGAYSTEIAKAGGSGIVIIRYTT
jgi:hypothetical protein